MSKWLPLGFMALFSGHGGSGKSTLALQLAVHVAMGIDFAGHKVTRSKVLVYSAEDDTNMLRRRLQGIVRHLGVDPVELSEWMRVIDATEVDATLFQDVGRGMMAKPQATQMLDDLYTRAGTFRAGLVLIDNRSEAYGSDENIKTPVIKFCRKLTRCSTKINAATLLLAHVDKQTAKGLSSQRYSGNTGWFNSARSMLYLGRTENKLLYTLEHDKLTMDIPEEPKQLRFEPVGDVGVMVPLAPEEVQEDPEREQCMEDLLEIMRKVGERKEVLVESSQSQRAFWKVAARAQRLHPSAKTWSREQWETAMDGLVERGLAERYNCGRDKSRGTMGFQLTNQGFFRDQAEEKW